LIGINVFKTGDVSAFGNVIFGILFYPGDEKYAFIVERFIPAEIGITFVEYGDVSFLQGYRRGNLRLMNLACSDYCKSRQVSRMVEFNMELDRSLSSAKFSPVVE
jgi:hypothetical protein